MKKSVKISLLTATILVIIGAVLFAAVMTICNWDFTKLVTVKYKTITYDAGNNFENIYISNADFDIIFKPSTDGKCKVVCYTQDKTHHTVKTENNTLTVKQTSKQTSDRWKWYDYIEVTGDGEKITVFLPENDYKNLTCKSDTGNIKLTDKFYFTNVSITTDTGDVFLDNFDAKNIKITTDTGNVKGTIQGNKTFYTKTDTGNVSVPKTTGKDKCTVITDTGDIIIKKTSTMLLNYE